MREQGLPTNSVTVYLHQQDMDTFRKELLAMMWIEDNTIVINKWFGIQLTENHELSSEGIVPMIGFYGGQLFELQKFLDSEPAW